jgi:hypothetical protein
MKNKKNVKTQYLASLSLRVIALLLCAPVALSAQNGVAVTNLAVAAGSPTTVTFDVSWTNTGMPAVWSDSVWVFVDYNHNGTMERLPLLPGATLTATSAPGVGAVEYAANNSKGVWVIGNARGAGSFSASVQLLTANASATGACAYASNCRPLGEYISATHLSFTGTPMYEVLLEHTGGSTMVVRSGSDFYVPADYTVQSFSDATGAPGVFTCEPMTGNIDFSVTPATAAIGQPVTFDVAVAPASPSASAITYTWSAPDFTPASHTGTPFSATAPAVTGNYPVTLTARSTGFCDLTKSKNVAVDCIHPATFTLTASASSFCAGSAGVTFGLSGTELDRYYQLYRGVAPVAILAGTGSAETFSGTFAVAGVYTARSIADGASCMVSMGGSHTVSENPLPAAPVLSLPADVCQNAGDIEFTATGYAGALEWVSDGGGAVSGNTVTFTSGVPGVKTVEARSKLAYSATLTCYSSTVTASATVYTVPAAPVMGGGGTQCGGSLTITATADNGIRWTDNSSTVSPRSVTTSGTYYAVTTSAEGCESAQAPVAVTIHPVPTITPFAGWRGPWFVDQDLPFYHWYTGNNITGIALSGGGFPTGISGTASGNTFTISGDVLSPGTFAFELTAYSAYGCPNATVADTIYVNHVPLPPDVVSTDIWRSKNTYVIWSDILAATPAQCTLVTHLNPMPILHPDYAVVNGMYYYNWECLHVLDTASVCPAPWRLPTRADFDDVAFNVSYYAYPPSWLPYGIVWGNSVHGPTYHYYWTEEAYNNDAYYFYADRDFTNVSFQTDDKHGGMPIRCVRDPN